MLLYYLVCIINDNTCCCFSDCNISQDSVATRFRCGGTFCYHFARNLQETWYGDDRGVEIYGGYGDGAINTVENSGIFSII